MITSFNVHDVTEVRAERHEGYVAVEVEAEPDEIEPRGRYEESASYRADMINAGRGHLLGE
jgi:hypothetical protein